MSKQQRMQANFRTTLELEFLIEKLMLSTGKRKTDVIQQAIINYAKDVLSEEDFNECLLKAAHDKLLKRAE